GVAVGVLGSALLLLPARAHAATCNGFIFIDYPTLVEPVPIGGEVDVRIFLAAGLIEGGVQNILNVQNFFYNLACDARHPITPFANPPFGPNPTGCVPDPADPVEFVPGSLSGVTCVPGGFLEAGSPFPQSKEIDTPGLSLKGVQNPGDPIVFCKADFKIRVKGPSGDNTPNTI